METTLQETWNVVGHDPELEDSTHSSTQGFFNPKELSTSTCDASRGLFQIGNWGFVPIPLPVYREGHGWDFGIDAIAAHGVNDPRGRRLILEGLASYNQREERVGGLMLVSPYWYCGDHWTISTPVQVFRLPERRGLAIGGYVGRGWGDGIRAFMISVRGVAEELTALDIAGRSNWSTGDHTWFAARVTGQGFLGRVTRDLKLELNASIGSNERSGDYTYRKAQCELEWAKPLTSVWLNAGTCSGELPVQAVFDLAVDGMVRGIPQWSARARSFWAGGIEQRVHFWHEFFGGVFATLAQGRDLPATFAEAGVCLVAARDDENTYAHDPFVHIDLTLYSSEADRYGSSSMWDAGRFMVRINFRVSDVDRDDIIRYRYPNR